MANGNFFDHKDHPTLLRAWAHTSAEVEKAGGGAVLALAGRPEGRQPAYEALCRELGILDSVRFLGEVGDVTGLLSAVDVGVLSTPTEGCPNAVLECMAMGLPVVATDVPGIREVVGDARIQLLAPPGDDSALGDALGRLATDADLRRRLGERNRLHVMERFAPERMLREHVELITRGLAERR